MKRVIAFLVAALMAITFSSCANSAEQIENEINSVVSQGITKGFARGTVDGNTYINEYMNIKMELPKSYYFLSDSEMKEIFGVSELYEDGAVVAYDVFARNDDGASVNIVYQLSAVSADVYLNMMVEEFSAGSMGGTLELCEKSTVKIGDSEVPCVNIEISQEDYEGNTLTMHETIAVKEKDSWIGIITVGAIKRSDIDTVISGIEF